MGHGIAVQVGAADALAPVIAVGEHVQQRLVVTLIQLGIRRGAVDQRQQGVFRPLLGADLGDDLLRQHIQRCDGDVQRVQLTSAHAVEQGGALNQIIAGECEQTAFGCATHVVAGAPDPLQKPVDGPGRADLAHQVDVADIDSQLQGGGGDQHLQLAGLEALLGVQAHLLGQAAVVGGHCGFAQALAQMPGQALGQTPGVDEDQRGAVLAR